MKRLNRKKNILKNKYLKVKNLQQLITTQMQIPILGFRLITMKKNIVCFNEDL